MQGSHNMGTMEYMEQYGINPITAYALVDNYISTIREGITQDKGADIQAHYNFYDSMYGTFKNEYKKTLQIEGLHKTLYIFISISCPSRYVLSHYHMHNH